MNESSINFQLVLAKALKYWYVFAILFPLSVTAAYFYLQYTPPMYQARTLLLIKDEVKSGQNVEESLFRELGLGDKRKNLENESLILGSTPIMLRTVQNLNLQYEYFKVEGIKKRSLYGESPIQVTTWEFLGYEAVFEGTVHVEGKNQYTLKFNGQEKRGEFGKELKFSEGKLTLTCTNCTEVDYPIFIRIWKPGYLAEVLCELISIEAVGKESSTLSLSIDDESPERACNLLMELVKVYNEQSVEDQNKAYASSLNLINERIEMISGELSAVESQAANYSQRYNAAELSAEGNMIMQELSSYKKEISTTDVQLEILRYIEDFLVKNRESFEYVPTNLSLTNLTLTTQLESFNQLLRERVRIRSISGPSHPDVILIEKQIQNIRNTIIESIKSIKSDLQLGRNANERLRSSLETRMQSLPVHERQLIQIERSKGVKENLYLYLLQKREESAISMSVTVPTGKLVEPAKSSAPISPKKAQIWLIAFFLGLALPAGFILLLYTINDKVQIEDDIQKATSVPVAGMLVYSKKNDPVVVKEKSRTVEAEMFRLLRANLSYIAQGKHLKSILVTSSVSGEGKSFIALNMGVAQAISGKKVVLIELDLRKPKQVEMLKGERTKKGIVDYIVDPELTAKRIINNSGIHPRLDIIGCGPKPPNPSELILSDRLRELIHELEALYDFIILDTPPVGLVADALQMKDLVEASMYVVRAGVTRKANLKIIKDIAEKNKLPNPFIVLNSVQLSNLSTYSSGYGYAYVSSNGYYEKS